MNPRKLVYDWRRVENPRKLFTFNLLTTQWNSCAHRPRAGAARCPTGSLKDVVLTFWAEPVARPEVVYDWTWYSRFGPRQWHDPLVVYSEYVCACVHAR